MAQTNDVRWVNDEDGLRCYLSEPASAGLPRVECYRRLLAHADDLDRQMAGSPGSGTLETLVRRVIERFEPARHRWHLHRIGQHVVGH